eukprot:509418-Prymnesium_polylepis.2
MPAFLSSSPPAVASSTPRSLSGQSAHPVKRLRSFQVDWPWRTGRRAREERQTNTHAETTHMDMAMDMSSTHSDR